MFGASSAGRKHARGGAEQPRAAGAYARPHCRLRRELSQHREGPFLPVRVGPVEHCRDSFEEPGVGCDDGVLVGAAQDAVRDEAARVRAEGDDAVEALRAEDAVEDDEDAVLDALVGARVVACEGEEGPDGSLWRTRGAVEAEQVSERRKLAAR